MTKKDLMLIVGAQVISTVIILVFLSFGGFKATANSNTNSDGNTAALNALSARLGQVQVDLNQIKAKLGAGIPTSQPK